MPCSWEGKGVSCSKSHLLIEIGHRNTVAYIHMPIHSSRMYISGMIVPLSYKSHRTGCKNLSMFRDQAVEKVRIKPSL